MGKLTIPRSTELRLEDLRKDLEKYLENVNKCNISMIEPLAFVIGQAMGSLNNIELTDGQRKLFNNFGNEYNVYSNKVKQCQCVRKLER